MQTAPIVILVCLAVIDQAGFTKLLHRPLIASALIGAFTGNLESALVTGLALEFLYISFGNDFISTKTMILTTVAANVLTLAGIQDFAVVNGSAGIILTLELCLCQVLAMVNTVFVTPARKAAEAGDTKKLGVYNFLPMVIRIAVYAAITVLILSHQETIYTTFGNLMNSFGWLVHGLSVAGYAVPCVGIAVLLRNLKAKDLPGAFFIGAATAAVFAFTAQPAVSAPVVAMAAFAIASYDYHMNKKDTPEKKKETEKKEEGGSEQWW